MSIRSRVAAAAMLAGTIPLAANAQESSRLDETIKAQVRPERPKSVFDGDFVIVGAGIAAAPTYEGSDNSRALPLIGATGEVKGIGFTFRGPSLSLDLVNIDLSKDISLGFSTQIRYRAGRSGNLKDDVVEKLPETDDVFEAGGRISLGFDELLSRKDKLSVGVSMRWDVSGKGSGYIVTPSATYRIPVNHAQVFGFLVSTQFMSGKYADYNFGIDAQGSSDSGLPVYIGKGGFKEWTLGVGTARDLSGSVLDGGMLIAAGVLYTRLYGSAAKSPITSIRGSRSQWFYGAGLAYIF